MMTTDLTNVRGVGPALEGQLHEAGFDTVADLAAADPGELAAMRGIGAVSARQIIAAAATLVPDPPSVASPSNEASPAGNTSPKKSKGNSKKKRKGKGNSKKKRKGKGNSKKKRKGKGNSNGKGKKKRKKA